jgi:hypothetical protein
MILQDISRRALSAGFVREQDDERGAEHHNKEGTATVPCCRTMRYGVATNFLASSSVHGNLSCARDGACSIQSNNCFSMAGLPVRCRVSLSFEHRVWVWLQSWLSNDPIENAMRCVQMLAELTRYWIKGYCGRGIAVCELVYIRGKFFLAGISPVGFCKMPAYLGSRRRNRSGRAQCLYP